jgi:anti-sigma regulatory factor (Ser/Thr protein kinase)
MMRIELVNRLEQISTVMAALEDYAVRKKLGKEVAQAAELALDELLTNIISYGYPEPGEHSIQIELSIEQNVLKIVVVDDGTAFNPFQHGLYEQNVSLGERRIGGLGIHLVKKFVDDYSFQRLQKRNIVTLYKSLD